MEAIRNMSPADNFQCRGGWQNMRIVYLSVVTIEIASPLCNTTIYQLLYNCILLHINSNYNLRGKELSEFSSSNNEGKKMQYQKFKVEHLHHKAILTVAYM